MASVEQLYPPSPSQVPPELTVITARYRLRVLLTVAALAAFLACYLGMLYGAYRLGVWIWNWSITFSGRAYVYALILKYGGLVAVGLFFLFLVRALFKRHRVATEAQVELTRESAPTLFAFLERLCAELGAPRPYRVIVDHNVNAALVYDVSILSLIVPPKKQLLIGLGLVNVLNLSELKAVLAHEFGHFSQKSTRLGSYVYVAHRVIYDLLFERDRLDDWLQAWCAQDLRLSLPAWILAFALYGTRRLLASIYSQIMRVYHALSRQMEFNADDAAVSVAGSDAIVHGLYKSDFASYCLSVVAEQLIIAADHGIYTDDMFYHQTQVAERERRRRGEPRLGLPAELPADPHQSHRLFEPTEEDRHPDPLATHPTLYQREQNAKRIYIRCPIDERSAWLLFDNAKQLRRLVTAAFYRSELERTPTQMQPAEKVQRFIDAELEEQELLERYHGLFASRAYFPCDPEKLAEEAVLEPQAVAEFLRNWPDQEAVAVGQRYQTIKAQRDALAQGLQEARWEDAETLKLSSGETLSIPEARQRVEELDAELASLEGRLHELDRRYLRVHTSIARRLDEAAGGNGQELSRMVERVKLQHALDHASRELERLVGALDGVLQKLGALSDETDEKAAEAAAQQLANDFYALQDQLKALCARLQTLRLPALPNIESGTTAHAVVVAPLEISIPEPQGSIPSAEELLAVSRLAYGMLPRLRRLQSKAIAGLVAQCEQLAARWAERHVAASAATTDQQAAPSPQRGGEEGDALQRQQRPPRG